MLLPAIAATISHTKAGSLWQVLQLPPEKKGTLEAVATLSSL